MDLKRLWMISPEIHSTRVAKETQTDSKQLIRILLKRQTNPKELVTLKEFPLTEKARREFIPALKSNLKINFK